MQPKFCVDKVIQHSRWPMPYYSHLSYYLDDSAANDIENLIKNMLNQKFKFYFIENIGQFQRNLMLVSALFDPKVHDLMSLDDKLNAENFIKDEYKKRAKASSKSSSSSANTISSNDPGGSATTPGQASKFDQFLNKCGVKATISSGKTKNRHLTIQQQLSKLRLLLKDNHDFMSFWSEYSSSIRDLSKLARKYMAITATSAPSEQAFSIANYVARKNRLSLSSKSIKYTMYLKDKL
ncbi:unnamed protein product [Didymodactylos carnosus]|uniref:HAT C-terminal dimerisation domain-containing protein n=1 Tax=Didymodactylos carnosus TaxID=1234261 RepID=A0A8S2LUY1_9BILA|nr:unnamed protein product [Didymodactylos carnosus]CAF3925152.1 unnamed protein product [Didymodactylos carnosus]